MKTLTRILISAACLLCMLSSPVFGASGGPLDSCRRTSIKDMAALQRGAGLFVNYCMSCHSADYMRYSRLSEDLGLDEEVVLENLVFQERRSAKQ